MHYLFSLAVLAFGLTSWSAQAASPLGNYYGAVYLGAAILSDDDRWSDGQGFAPRVMPPPRRQMDILKPRIREMSHSNMIQGSALAAQSAVGSEIICALMSQSAIGSKTSIRELKSSGRMPMARSIICAARKAL